MPCGLGRPHRQTRGQPHQHKRSGDRLKFKCGNQQELVIGGFTSPRGSRVGFGALLVGYYDRGQLRFAGKVGTGYNTETLHRLGARLSRLKQPRLPFADAAQIQEREVTGVKPSLVAEVAFSEWTRDGKLRQWLLLLAHCAGCWRPSIWSHT